MGAVGDMENLRMASVFSLKAVGHAYEPKVTPVCPCSFLAAILSGRLFRVSRS